MIPLLKKYMCFPQQKDTRHCELSLNNYFFLLLQASACQGNKIINFMFLSRKCDRMGHTMGLLTQGN